MNNWPTIPTQQRLDLLEAIGQIPEEYIPELLKLVHSFSQTAIKKNSVNNWNDAVARINSHDNIQNQLKQKRIQEMFQYWSDLDDKQEQQETLKIIESMERISV